MQSTGVQFDICVGKMKSNRFLFFNGNLINNQTKIYVIQAKCHHAIEPTTIQFR